MNVNRYNLAIFWVLSSFLSIHCFAQTEPIQAQTFYFEGDSLLWGWIEYTPTKSEHSDVHTLLFLHGAGERGQDLGLAAQVGVSEIVSQAEKKGEKVRILLPQCPEGSQWVDTPFNSKSHTMSENSSRPMKVLLALLDSIHPTLNNTIKGVGLSMGGYGIWEVAARRPNYFSCIAPICGGGDPNQIHAYKNISIWIFHGKKDTLVPFSRSEAMASALKQSKHKHFTCSFYDSVGHGAWVPAFKTPSFYEWLFKEY